MNSFSLFEIFLLFGIGQGVFLALVLTSLKESNKPVNRLLGIIVLFATIMLTGRVFSFLMEKEWVIRFAQFADACIFLFGPLVYFYLRRLSNTASGNYTPSYWHFLPVLMHFSFSLWTSIFSMAELNDMYLSGGLMHVIIGVEYAGLISLFSYWCAAYMLIRQVRRESAGSRRSYLNGISGYMNSILFFVGATVLFWILSLSGKLWEIWPFTLISYELLWSVTPLFFYFLGYYSLAHPSILRQPSIPKIQRDRLDFSAAQELKSKLDYLIHEEKLFVKSDLTLRSLAERLETSANNLSWLLNKVHQKPFYDYINEVRVKAFQEKVANNEHHIQTLLSLALDVGFKSKSTFNKSFKAVIGQTPSQYVKKSAQKEYEGTQ